MLERFEPDLLAMVIAALAYFMLGAAWFTPLFGKAYDRALDTHRSKDQKWPAIYYVGPLVSACAATVATAILLRALHVQTLGGAIELGLVTGVGYAASISVNNAINPKTPRPLLYGLVTGSYHLAGITLVASILFLME